MKTLYLVWIYDYGSGRQLTTIALSKELAEHYVNDNKLSRGYWYEIEEWNNINGLFHNI